MNTTEVPVPVSNTEQLLVFLLTDVESSTQHWLRHPQRMPAALDVLDAAVGCSVSPFGGEIVRARGEGDSHFVVFSRASAAVRASAKLQRCLQGAAWPSGAEFRVRIAIHAGEVQRRDGDYAGVAIHHAARLRSTAHGGQVVVSRAIVELLGNSLEDELRFEGLGRHRIRDVPGWTEVFQLCGPSLPASFPPLVTLHTGLPPVTAIVFLDAVGTSRTAEGLTPDEERAALGRLAELFAKNFSMCEGQYLKHLGDGCVALFADPEGGSRSLVLLDPTPADSMWRYAASCIWVASTSYATNRSDGRSLSQRSSFGMRHPTASRSAPPPPRSSTRLTTSSPSSHSRQACRGSSTHTASRIRQRCDAGSGGSSATDGEPHIAAGMSPCQVNVPTARCCEPDSRSPFIAGPLVSAARVRNRPEREGDSFLGRIAKRDMDRTSTRHPPHDLHLLARS